MPHWQLISLSITSTKPKLYTYLSQPPTHWLPELIYQSLLINIDIGSKNIPKVPIDRVDALNLLQRLVYSYCSREHFEAYPNRMKKFPIRLVASKVYRAQTSKVMTAMGENIEKEVVYHHLFRGVDVVCYPCKPKVWSVKSKLKILCALFSATSKRC